jgi:ribonucleoside-diphosphate reductase beta chain
MESSGSSDNDNNCPNGRTLKFIARTIYYGRMKTMIVIKKNGERQAFNKSKIEKAIKSAMKRVKTEKIIDSVLTNIAEQASSKMIDLNVEEIHVDKIHEITEDTIMSAGYFELAREYITYRFAHKKNIFKKRMNLKPYDYPELMEYVNAIRHSYWIHTEFNYNSDIQDMKVSLMPEEAAIVERTMLAIAQIEVSVKTFWSKIFEKFPKPEFQSVGVTFAESEVRHADAYSNLLELLSLNDRFETLMDVPAIKKRVDYLTKTNKATVSNEEYFNNIILFSMFVENVSLFSQFLIMMAFNKHRNILKGISNAVEATSKEEDIHARFGFEIVNIIKNENPEWFTDEVIENIKKSCLEAYEAEANILEWIYGPTDLDFLPISTVKEFVKNRFNDSMKAIGLPDIFEVDKKAIKDTNWFIEETLSTKNIDFFVKKSVAYSKKTKSFTEDDLF